MSPVAKGERVIVDHDAGTECGTVLSTIDGQVDVALDDGTTCWFPAGQVRAACGGCGGDCDRIVAAIERPRFLDAVRGVAHCGALSTFEADMVDCAVELIARIADLASGEVSGGDFYQEVVGLLVAAGVDVTDHPGVTSVPAPDGRHDPETGGPA